MPIDPKDMLEYLGYSADKFEKIDEFKEDVNKSWIKKPDFDSEMGKTRGIIETKARQTAKAFGIELTDDVKKLPAIDMLEKITQIASETYKSKNEELTRLSSGGDTAVKEWQEKYTKLEKKHNETSDLISSLKSENERILNESNNVIKNFKLTEARESAFSALKFSPDVDDVKKRGFMSIINDEFELDLDESNKAFIKDKKTGNRLKSDKKAGEWLSIYEVFEKKALDFKMLELKPTQQQKTINTFTVFNSDDNNNNNNNSGGGRQRNLHPNLKK